MAVIGKIQKNSLLLLIVIGLAMLAFIFTDFLRGGGGDIERLETATLNGESIDVVEYEELKEIYVNRAKNEYLYQGKEFPESARQTAENNAFNEVVRRSLLNDEFEKLGLVCTTEELNDMIHGNHIHPWVLQIPLFQGANGFSKDSVRKFINSLEVDPGGDEATQTAWMESRQQWKDFEKELKEARKADKYVALIKKGLFVNKLEAADQYNGMNSSKKVQFVMQRYSDIPEDEVAVTDEDIKAYFDAHKDEKKYEQEEARDIEMITFPIVPTEADKADIEGQLMGLVEPFEAAENNIAFAYQNSDSDFLSDSSIFKMGGDQMVFNPQGGTYPKSIDDAIQEAEIGDIVGPFETAANELALAKVIEKPTENQAWVRHILISTGAKRSEERAKEIADSVMRVIRTNDNFAEMVPVISEDPGSMQNGGEYKWFAEGVMVPEFNDASFNGAIGQLQLVKTSYGYHIVEVLGRAERVTPVLAVVTKRIKPSEATLSDIESRAYDLIYAINDSNEDSAFYKIATDSGKTVQSTRVLLSNDYVLGVNNSDRMLRFAFNKNTVKGDISDPILDDNKYVVAYVTNVIEEGAPEFDDVKEMMRIPALRDKQAEVYIEKMGGKSNLQDVAALLTNGAVRNAEVKFSENTVVRGARQDPKVVGQLFTNIPVGTITKPIQGEDGVYVFVVQEETPAPETTDYSTVLPALELKRVSVADNGVIQALREKADLVDNRRRIEFE